MKFGKFFYDEVNELSLIFKNINIKSLKVFSNLCDEAFKMLKKQNIILGNGGSAADAQHLAAELVVKYKKKKSPSCNCTFY